MWSLIVQLRAHSQCHSLQCCWGVSWDSQSVLNDQTSVWQQYHYKKSCFQVFQICFSRIRRRFITYAWNLSRRPLGFWIARDIRQKVLMKSRNPEGIGKAFDLENLREQKETVLSVNAESRPVGAIWFQKWKCDSELHQNPTDCDFNPSNIY